jgi:hypothetical protein
VKLKDYSTVWDEDPQELDSAVRSMVRLGWEPYGPQTVTVSVTEFGQMHRYHQVLVLPSGETSEGSP